MKYSFFQSLLLVNIGFYQKFLSPDHSWLKTHYPWGFCKYYPSCSEYAHGSIKKYGALKGSWLATKRLCRCHPWNSGGLDLVK